MADLVNTELDSEQNKNRTEDTSPDINKPEPVPKVTELFDQMNLNAEITDDLGAYANIDCQPDFRIILYQLIDHSIRIFEQQKNRNIPSITPASLLATFMHQVNAFGALADVYYVRGTMSRHASIFSEYMIRRQTLNIASWIYTPPFIKDILEGLYPTFDPVRKNLSFIYTFASFSFYHDLGRFFPLHMFLALHNIIAEKGANATTDEVWYTWLDYIVYRTPTEEIKVANIIGGAYNDAIVDNFLSKKLRKLLSITTSDQRQRKAVYQVFKFPSYPEQEDLEVTDAYSLLLSADTQMIPSIDIFHHTMSAQFQQIFKNCGPLGSLFAAVSGTNIMNHYYDELQPPTFHTYKVNLTERASIKTQTYSQFLTDLKYRCTFYCTQKADYNVTFIEPNVPYSRSISLVSTSMEQPDDPDIKQSSFSQILNRSPVYLYSPWSTGPSSMYYALTNGLHIETSEIDSFHVPYPRTDTPLHDENSIFLSSAIPINATVDTRSLKGNSNLFTRYRSYDSDYEHRISHSLYDMTEHRLPMYPTAVAADTTGNPFPGFTKVTGIIHANLASQKIAYSGNTQWKEKICKSTFPIEPFIWSSYRWINPSLDQTAPATETGYFIADFRPLYGTTPQTYKSYHLYDLIN